MSAEFRRRSLVLLSCCALLVCAFAAWSGAASDSDASGADVAVFPWGDPSLVDGDQMVCIGPAWCAGAGKRGGAWVSSLNGSPVPGWVVGDSDTNVACLLIGLNRTFLTNDLRMDVTLVASTGAILSVDLVDGTGATVGASPASNLVVAADVAAMSSLVLPLRERLTATAIRLRRQAGGIVVYSTVLAPVAAAALGTVGSAQPGGSSTIAPDCVVPADSLATGSISAAGADTPAAVQYGEFAATTEAASPVDAITRNALHPRLTSNRARIQCSVTPDRRFFIYIQGEVAGQGGAFVGGNTQLLLLRSGANPVFDLVDFLPYKGAAP